MSRQDLIIEFRWADTVEQLNRAAADLVQWIPIYLCGLVDRTEPAAAALYDPDRLRHQCRSGWFRSCGQPYPTGRNHAGLADIQPEITGKRLEILKETIADVRRIGVMWSPRHLAPPVLEAAQVPSGSSGSSCCSLAQRMPTISTGHSRAVEDHASACSLCRHICRVQRALLAELTLRSRLPSCSERGNVEPGVDELAPTMLT